MKNRKYGIALSYVNTALSMVCGLFLSSYLLRMLGATEYGVYQTVSSFASYLVMFEFGLGSVASRNIAAARALEADGDQIKKQISTIFVIAMVLSSIIVVVSGIFYFSIDSIYKESLTPAQIEYGKVIFIIVSLDLILSFYIHTINGVLLSYEKYVLRPVISIVQIASRTIIIAVLVFFFKYAIIISIVNFAICFLIVLFEVIYCISKLEIRFSFKYFDVGIFKYSLPFAFAIFLQSIVNQANSNVDKFVIGVVLNPESVALYSVALYIFSSFSSITNVPISMYGPQLTKDVVLGASGDELTEKLVPPGRLIALTGGSILFGFIAVGQQFVEVVYGKDYSLAWIIAIIIMVPMFVNMTNGALVNVLNAKNKRLARSLVLTGTTVANIVLTVIWINIYGMIGAAVATAVCTFVGQILIMNIYYSKALGIKIMRLFRKSFKGILVFQIISAVITYFVAKQITNTKIAFLVGIIMFLIIELSGFFLFGANESEKGFLKRIRSRK